jgi:hypothetical protein
MLATRPFAIDWKIDVDGVDALPLKPYFEVQTNVILTSGAVSAKGRVTAGALPAGTSAGFSGDVTIHDFGALDRPTAQELMRWKTLTLTGINVTETPPKVALGVIGVDQFFARLIVNSDATLNLQRLLAPPTTQSAAAPHPRRRPQLHPRLRRSRRRPLRRCRHRHRRRQQHLRERRHRRRLPCPSATSR